MIVPAISAAVVGALGAGVAWWRAPRPLSLALLREVMPKLEVAKARAYLPLLNEALREFRITTPPRLAAFLAQLAHESAELRHFEELTTGEAYEGRKDLGNTQPGDGKRYKGRGPIQLTGRNNYRVAGQVLHVPLEERPELAAEPAAGFRVAAWFWASRGLNTIADRDSEEAFTEITRRINGGYNGLEDRKRYWRRAQAALGGKP